MAGRLNLSALRDGFFAPTAATQGLPNPPVGLTPAKLQLVQGAGTVTFTLDGTARWLIDINRFAGTPSLTLVPGQGEVVSRLTLTGAQLPGTDVPADFVVLIGKTGPNGTYRLISPSLSEGSTGRWSWRIGWLVPQRCNLP